jgi:hypothetical protein
MGFDPHWFHQCPCLNEQSEKSFVFTAITTAQGTSNKTVHSSALSGSTPICHGTISFKEVIERVEQSEKGSLSGIFGTRSPIHLELNDVWNTSIVGWYLVPSNYNSQSRPRIGSYISHGKHEQAMRKTIQNRQRVIRVDPAWFETPVERMGVSGGTAPCFRLVMTEKGVKECPTRNDDNGNILDKTYWIGLDQNHAQDERDFYETILQKRKTLRMFKTFKMTDLPDHNDVNARVPPNCANSLGPFFFDYLRILETLTTENPNSHSQLLVMQNLYRHSSNVRILDL